MGQNRRFWKWDKTADFRNGTKPPISETGQNRRFRKRDKTTDSKVGQKRRFCKRESTIKIVSLIEASWPNYR